MKKYYCDEYEHIGQVHISEAEKELNRINSRVESKDEFKIIECDVFVETSDFDYDKEIETSENHVRIVKNKLKRL